MDGWIEGAFICLSSGVSYSVGLGEAGVRKEEVSTLKDVVGLGLELLFDA